MRFRVFNPLEPTYPPQTGLSADIKNAYTAHDIDVAVTSGIAPRVCRMRLDAARSCSSTLTNLSRAESRRCRRSRASLAPAMRM